uniref:Uncharacterized protein n=1 Tax=Ascaris lumbricoides TaxID=6252 RepID=A0A9J2PVS0_ASCLU
MNVLSQVLFAGQILYKLPDMNNEARKLAALAHSAVYPHVTKEQWDGMSHSQVGVDLQNATERMFKCADVTFFRFACSFFFFTLRKAAPEGKMLRESVNSAVAAAHSQAIRSAIARTQNKYLVVDVAYVPISWHSLCTSEFHANRSTMLSLQRDLRYAGGFGFIPILLAFSGCFIEDAGNVTLGGILFTTYEHVKRNSIITAFTGSAKRASLTGDARFHSGRVPINSPSASALSLRQTYWSYRLSFRIISISNRV